MGFRTILVFLFFPLISSAAIPTVEGLFRNAKNPEINGRMIYLTMAVENSRPAELGLEGIKKEESHKRFFKILISLERERRFEVIQAEYKTQGFRDEDIVDVKIFKDFIPNIENNSGPSQHLYYSLLFMYSLNSSTMMNSFLKKYSPDYMTNQELLNGEKVRLLNDYRRYLQAVKSDKVLKDQLPSPLSPRDPEEKERVKKIMRQSMYNNSGAVTLEKRDDKFFWKVGLSNLAAYFTSEEHRLTKLNFNRDNTLLTVTASDYVLFNGAYEFPRRLDYRTNENAFETTILSYKIFQGRGKNFSERIKEYRNDLDKVKKSGNRPTPLSTAILWPLI